MNHELWVQASENSTTCFSTSALFFLSFGLFSSQKGPSAVARLAQLPVVHSACSKLLVLYADTKCNHPSLKSVCEVLENKVTALGSAACHRVSPVMVKLEPQSEY